MTALEAIARSISHDEIVHIEASIQECAVLNAECEDYIQANGIREYWGEDSDGNTWRVHAEPAGR